MKKQLLLIVLVTILLVGGTLIVIYFLFPHNTMVEEFNIDDYQEIIASFPSPIICDNVSDPQKAISTAEKIWIEIYGAKIKKQKPYKVFYDSINDIWLIQGTLPDNTMGGVANILIEKRTGKVLAVWHDK